ncbi:MAG: nuclear transport factor 2 family protein [Chloroflexota bacterium]
MHVPNRTIDFTPAPEDLDAITRVSNDYFEAWYTGDVGRMKRSLHSDLAKRSLRRDPDTGAGKLGNTSAQRMEELTRQGEGTSTPVNERSQVVTILDTFENIATVKVVSYEYVEYLHVAKFDTGWLIVNTLWALRMLESE